MKNNSTFRAFTLTEMMIGLTVMSILMAGVMTFYISGVTSMYGSDQRMKLASQIKKFSNELIIQASRSNQFVLFKSANPADFDGTNTALLSGNSDRQFMIDDGSGTTLHPAGDFVVFVYYEIPKPTAQAMHRINKLEGYFLQTNGGGEAGKVTKVVIDLSSAPSTNTIEAILTAKWNIVNVTDQTRARFTDYFPLVRGLAKPEVVDGAAVTTATTPQPPGRLFYMSAARNVIISGQIFSSNKDINTNDRRTFTNSFCFNITPRT